MESKFYLDKNLSTGIFLFVNYFVERDIPKKGKGSFSYDPCFRGPERIRTAVEAFAELCLATRPQDLF